MSKKKSSPDGVKTIYDGFNPQDLQNAGRNPHTYRTRLIERMYVRLLTELAVGRFKWNNVPEEIDVRFLELELYRNAFALFYFEPDFDKYIVSRATPIGNTNLYDNPVRYQSYGNGTTYTGKMLKRKHCVPIWANAMRTPDLDIVEVYAYKLASIERTIEMNIANAKSTKIIASTNEQKLGLLNITRQFDEGVPVIPVDSSQYEPGMISTLDLGVHPDFIINLDIEQTRIWSRCMGLLGIDNANQDKKERLVSSEIDANAQQIHSMKRVNLNEREIACERINKKYGLDMSVEFHVDAEPESGDGNGGPIDESLKVY